MILIDSSVVMPTGVENRLAEHFGCHLDWQPMQCSGTRHDLFRAQHEGLDWIARIDPGRPAAPGVNPLREQTVLQAVKPYGWALQAELHLPELGLLLMRDAGVSLKRDQLGRSQINSICIIINDMHKISNVDSLNYSDLFAAYRNAFKPQMRGLLQLVDETEQLLRELPDIGLCCVHHDLHTGNILWGDQPTLIDWEYAGLGNPWLDYATLEREIGLSGEQLKIFDRLAELDDASLKHGLARAIQLIDQLDSLWQSHAQLPRLEKLMSNTQGLLEQLKQAPESVEFEQVMAVIAAEYRHTASAFKNGEQVNSAEQNQGSCKILGFARLNGLTEQQTLYCFGRYYRDDVLQHPEGSDHGNIRAFMRTGWAGVQLHNDALVRID